MVNMVSFTLRIDEELMDKIRYISEVEKRSINSEILYILEEYTKKFEEEKK